MTPSVRRRPELRGRSSSDRHRLSRVTNHSGESSRSRRPGTPGARRNERGRRAFRRRRARRRPSRSRRRSRTVVCGPATAGRRSSLGGSWGGRRAVTPSRSPSSGSSRPGTPGRSPTPFRRDSRRGSHRWSSELLRSSGPLRTGSRPAVSSRIAEYSPSDDDCREDSTATRRARGTSRRPRRGGRTPSRCGGDAERAVEPERVRKS